jgi:peptide deformylase
LPAGQRLAHRLDARRALGLQPGQFVEGRVAGLRPPHHQPGEGRDAGRQDDNQHGEDGDQGFAHPGVLADSPAGRERTVNKLTAPEALITSPAMALRDIIILPDKRLRLVSEPVGKITAETRKLVEDMFDTMYEAPGIGLAAIQVGVPLRVVTMDLSKKEGEKEPRVFINPEIVWSSDDPSVYEEGCLSIPEVHEDVERPAKVRVKYLDLDGKPHEEEAEGLFATCIQHEVDHLNGKLFIDRISKLKRDRIVKKFTKAAKRAEEDA